MPRIIPAPGGSGGSTFGIDNAQQGLWVPAGAPMCSQLNFALQANKLMLIRIVAPKTVTVSKYKFVVTTAAGADDPCDAGIYNSDLSVLLGSSGPTSGKLNAVAVQTLNFQAPITLIAGQIYHVGFSQGALGGTAAQVLGTNNPFYMNNVFGSTPPYWEQSSATLHPLSTPVPSPGTGTNNGPVAALQT